jgi:hypothetical protein
MPVLYMILSSVHMLNSFESSQQLCEVHITYWIQEGSRQRKIDKNSAQAHTDSSGRVTIKTDSLFTHTVKNVM